MQSKGGLRDIGTPIASTLPPTAMVGFPVPIASLLKVGVGLPAATLLRPTALLLPGLGLLCGALRLRGLNVGLSLALRLSRLVMRSGGLPRLCTLWRLLCLRTRRLSVLFRLRGLRFARLRVSLSLLGRRLRLSSA